MVVITVVSIALRSKGQLVRMLGEGEPGIVEALIMHAPLLAAASAVVLCLWFYEGLLRWLSYMAPAAVVFSLLFPYNLGLFTYQGEAGQPPAAGAGVLKQPVLILLFDGLAYDALLRDGQIDEALYPNFAALARESVEFTNATSNFASTWYSVPSMLSGELLPEDASREYVTSRNILTRMAQSDPVFVYQEALAHCLAQVTHCFHAYHSTPIVRSLADSNQMLAMRFAMGNKGLFGAFVRNTVSLRDDKFDAVVSQIKDLQTQRGILFYQTLITHEPYIMDEHGDMKQVTTFESMGAEAFDILFENYRDVIRLADRRLGILRAQLREAGLYDDAIIVITADHGLRPASWRAGWNAEELTTLTTRVPLLVKAPGLAPHRSNVDYQHIDFVPTFLDILGLEGSTAFAGRSALSARQEPRQKLFYFGPPKPGHLLVSEDDGRQWVRADAGFPLSRSAP